MSEQREVLDSLQQHPGWALFCAHVEREWGVSGLRFQQELDRALNLTDNDACASQSRQIRSGQKIIMSLLRWPAEEMQRLKRVERAETQAGDESTTELTLSMNPWMRGGW